MVSRENMASVGAPTRLYAFLLRVRPVQSGTLMAFTGELVHAAFLNWLRQTAPDVSEWLHQPAWLYSSHLRPACRTTRTYSHSPRSSVCVPKLVL